MMKNELRHARGPIIWQMSAGLEFIPLILDKKKIKFPEIIQPNFSVDSFPHNYIKYVRRPSSSVAAFNSNRLNRGSRRQNVNRPYRFCVLPTIKVVFSISKISNLALSLFSLKMACPIADAFDLL